MLTSVGQVYPRSLDFDVVAALVQLVSGPSNLATTVRLMAGHELVTEGFKEGQVGSSAMPHKMNTRSCERVNGLAVILRGHLSMVSELAGDQWNEGDVSCSVVRRVALPDAFFATDGLFQTFLTVLDEFGAFPAVIQRELDRYLPFLTTTKVLMAAVRNGVGREAAHEAIKEAAVGTALAMRAGQVDNDVFAKLAADERLGLTRDADRGARRRPDRVHRRRRRPDPRGRRPGRGAGGPPPRRSGVRPGRHPLTAPGGRPSVAEPPGPYGGSERDRQHREGGQQGRAGGDRGGRHGCDGLVDGHQQAPHRAPSRSAGRSAVRRRRRRPSRGGTSARLRVKLGEMTPPPPTPARKSAGPRVHQRVSEGEVTSQAESAVPVIITDSATRVIRRPIRPTSRPASGEVVAAPTANGVMSSAVPSGEKPSPSCRWTDSTRKIPVKPVK